MGAWRQSGTPPSAKRPTASAGERIAARELRRLVARVVAVLLRRAGLRLRGRCLRSGSAGLRLSGGGGRRRRRRDAGLRDGRRPGGGGGGRGGPAGARP